MFTVHPPPGRHRLGARASRPHPYYSFGQSWGQYNDAGNHPVAGNRIGQAESNPWRRSRLIRVGEMAEVAPGLVRAGRPRSQEVLISGPSGQAAARVEGKSGTGYFTLSRRKPRVL